MDVTEHSKIYKSLLNILNSAIEIPWFESILDEYKIGMLTSKLNDLFQKYEALRLVSFFLNN
jgi:hypothetical protein